MARFDRPCMTFYQSAIVTIALCCRPTVYELLDVEYYRVLEMWVRGHSRSLKVHLKVWVRFPNFSYPNPNPRVKGQGH